MTDDEIFKLTDHLIEEQLRDWPTSAPFGILRTAIAKDLMVPAMTLIALTVRNRTREVAIEAAREERYAHVADLESFKRRHKNNLCRCADCQTPTE